jgi:hypothetical protein
MMLRRSINFSRLLGVVMGNLRAEQHLRNYVEVMGPRQRGELSAMEAAGMAPDGRLDAFSKKLTWCREIALPRTQGMMA